MADLQGSDTQPSRMLQKDYGEGWSRVVKSLIDSAANRKGDEACLRQHSEPPT